MIVLIIILIIILLWFILSFILAYVGYKSVFLRRYQNARTKFSFVGEKEPFCIKSKIKRINGYIYTNGEDNIKGVIVFCHGILTDHKNYMVIVRYFTSRNYIVVGYDALGSGESSGKGIHSLYESKEDLKHVLYFLENHFKEYPFYLIGHSLGGYAVSNINDSRVKGVVSISGFLDRKKILKHLWLKAFSKREFFMIKPFVYYLETRDNKYVENETIKNIESSPSSYLLIYSLDDNMVPPHCSQAYYYQDKNIPNVKVKLFETKGHNGILNSEKAMEYRHLISEAYNNLKKENTSLTFSQYFDEYVDEAKYDEGNEEVLKLILDFFEKL